jgi:peptidoglycan/LPS O-acetylase OafA/YrhL
MNIENIPDYLKYMSAIAAILFSVFYIYTERLDSLVASLLLVTSIYVNAPKKENTIMNIISEHSFGIYLIHSPLIYITFAYMLNANPIIVVTLNFVIFGTIAFAISHFIKKTPVKFIIGI